MAYDIFKLLHLLGVMLLRDAWLVWVEAMFLIAGVIWLGLPVPIQVRQARMACGIAASGGVPRDHYRLGRLWIVRRSIATLLLLATMWLMLRKGW